MAQKPPVTFFWFRRDLRIDDNTGLAHALQSGQPVVCAFIFDTLILNKLEDRRDARMLFIHRQLQKIDGQLRASGSMLLTGHGKPEQIWKQWMQQFNIAAVYANNDYEPYARERDTRIEKILSEQDIRFYTYKDHVVFEKHEVCKDDGSPYTVFTPYKNKYLKLLTKDHYKPVRVTVKTGSFFPVKAPAIPPLPQLGFETFDFHFPGSDVSDKLIKQYAETRNIPGVAGTSRLSVHLRFGTVSIRNVFHTAVRLKADVWLNELIWRDFYHMILWHFPNVKDQAFKSRYDNIPWRNNESEFQKWCEGRTGYPIVDAGMRELNATGFMHNRVRMITASFLVKHLLVDWRWGEAYFAKKLLDFDLAANNGGWQWAAGSGVDAAPYFRIFNPEEQTRKFDPELSYIKKWVPEIGSPAYPPPVTDHKTARERCLNVFKNALANW